MRVENQVCSVEQSKHLARLQIYQQGIYSWLYNIEHGEFQISGQTVESLELLRKAHPGSKDWGIREQHGFYSAWNVAELLLMLPKNTVVWFNGKHWNCKTSGVFGDILGDSAACVLAAQLISLLEIKKITSEEINKTLTSK